MNDGWCLVPVYSYALFALLIVVRLSRPPSVLSRVLDPHLAGLFGTYTDTYELDRFVLVRPSGLYLAGRLVSTALSAQSSQRPVRYDRLD